METAAENVTITSYIAIWAESLATVLGQIASTPYSMSVISETGEGLDSQDQDTYLNITASGSLRGESVFRLPSSTARTLVDTFTGELKSGAPITADDRAALEELIRQVAGHVSTSAKEKFGTLQLTVSTGTPPTWPAAASGWIRSGEEPATAIIFEWRISAALNSALGALEPGRGPSSDSRNIPVSDENSALDMFMNLELDVSIRFGGRDVLLKDVLELGPGAVLELDRDVNDPADLLLDGKIIARGDVVLVDGFLGLKITQVIGTAQFN